MLAVPPTYVWALEETKFAFMYCITSSVINALFNSIRFAALLKLPGLFAALELILDTLLLSKL